MPAALYSPKLNTLSPDTWPGRANIHTYYTRIHVKTTVGAKGEDENRGEKQGVSQSVEVTEDKAVFLEEPKELI